MTRHLPKRSLILSGHGTSVALEPECWVVLDDMAKERNQTIGRLVETIDGQRDPNRPLASALRVAALQASRSDDVSSLGQDTVRQSSPALEDWQKNRIP